MRRSRLSLAVVVSVATAAVVGAPTTAVADHVRTIPVQLLAMNDFHGRISQTTGSDSQQLVAPGPDGAYGTADDVVETVGGSAHVAATVDRLKADFAAAHADDAGAASFFVGAGDLISASSFESSVFKDEPTVEVLNAMGLDVSSVGNHEFDRGTDELRRISGATDGTFTDDVTACQGITPGVDGCFGEGEHAFHGTDFPYLAANVISKETGEPMLPPYQIFEASDDVRIAVIGVTTRTTPGIVSPDGIADVEFIDEADAVNRWVPRLLRHGIKAIAVLVHEGGAQTGPSAANPNGCDSLTGPIVDINQRTHPQVDLIVSAHSHTAYDCLLPVPGGKDRLVTQAGYYGRLVSDIRLEIGRNGDVDRRGTYAATNVPVTRTSADARVQSIVDYWNDRSAEARNRVVGELSAPAARPKLPNGSDDRTKESSLGNLVADAQLEIMQQRQFGFPVVAFMNPGGLRADLDEGTTTYGELYAVQPFGNTVNAVTLSGADIDQVLEQQFVPRGSRARLALGTSTGFTYDYDLGQPMFDRVSNIRLDGALLDPAGSYRVAANSFLTAGGDDFTAFRNGTGLVTGPVDVDALEAYFAARDVVTPPPANHGTQIG